MKRYVDMTTLKVKKTTRDRLKAVRIDKARSTYYQNYETMDEVITRLLLKVHPKKTSS